MFVTHKPLVKMEISKGWTHGCAFSWDQNLDFMFSSGHKKKIGKRHLSLTKFRLCGTCWQDSGEWNCDMTKFLHSQKCDNYYVFQYFNSSLGGSMGLSSYSGLIKHEWIKLVENISNRYIVLSIFLYYLIYDIGWVKKNWDLKKYVYCSEGHKNQANKILILCMFFSTLGHLV